MKPFPLHIVSQDKELVSEKIDSVTIPTAGGEITVLYKHIPLFAKVKTGVLTYRAGADQVNLVVSDGFVNVAPTGAVTVMVDNGILERDISLQKAEAAVKAAQETMQKTQDQRELVLAEASLRRAMLEVQVAQRTHKAKI